MRRAWLGPLVALAALAAAPAAHAATLTVEDGVLAYTAAPGENNDVEIYPGNLPGSIAVFDYMGNIEPGTACVSLPEPFFLPELVMAYECPGVDTGVAVELGDLDDFAWVDVDVPVTGSAGDGSDFLVGGFAADQLDGGPGDDGLLGGMGSDRLTGGDGNDELLGDYGESVRGPEMEEGIELPSRARRSTGVTLRARADEDESSPGQPDVLDGGAGDDRLSGDGGTDTLAGGPGVDRALYTRMAAVTVTLDGVANDGSGAESENVGGDMEGAVTGSGADVLRGNAGANVFTAGTGDDDLDGGAGEDTLVGLEGDDRFAARDGARDSIDCHAGRDSVVADAGDEVIACEAVELPAGGGAPGAPGSGPLRAVTAAALSLKPSATRRGVRLRGTIVLPACADRRACAGAAVRVTATVRRAKRSTVAVLGADCGFSASIPMRLKRTDKVKLTAATAATSLLASATGRATVRVRR